MADHSVHAKQNKPTSTLFQTPPSSLQLFWSAFDTDIPFQIQKRI
jgi:hypothetical protein